MTVWVVYEHNSDSLGGSYASVRAVFSSEVAANEFAARNKSAWCWYDVSEEMIVDQYLTPAD